MALSFQDAAARTEFVLVRPSHPGNVGAAARALRVMGFTRLTVVEPRHADVARHPEALAFASGAQDVLASCRVVGSLDEALAGATLAVAISAAGREFAPEAQLPEVIAARCRSELAADAQAAVTLVFGTERTGLLIGEALRCQALCSIPGAPDYGSLNLAQAVQVLAYTMRRVLLGEAAAAPEPSRSEGASYATNEQVEALFVHLESSLVEIGFLDPRHPKKLMPRLRRLLSRTRLEVAEVDLLRGICTQIERYPERFK